MLTEEKREFIAFMVASDVLSFGEFVTKSGRNSPYFVNTGNYKTGKQVAELGRFYAGLVHQTIGDAFDVMFGPAYKGIPLAASCAAFLWEGWGIDKPYFFNRKEEKDHGEGGSIVGYTPVAGDRIILIEDVITAGTAIREVMPLLTHFGDVRVRDMFISVDRMEYGQTPGKTAVMEVSEEFGIQVHAIVDVEDIREWLVESGGSEEEIARMDAYRAQYCVGK
ncbi:MAG: orotate phosphoribosyltransferase [Clostridiales bacterium]|nr:orotate phosphoribosyltransferase [Clostridiales bacterium]